MVEAVNSFGEEGLTELRSREANKNMQEITEELSHANGLTFSRCSKYLTALLATVLRTTTTFGQG